MNINDELRTLVDTMVETIASPDSTEETKKASSRKLILFLNEHESEIDLSSLPEKEMRDGQMVPSRVRLIAGRLLNTEHGKALRAKTAAEI